jgi:hypothetical protein
MQRNNRGSSRAGWLRSDVRAAAFLGRRSPGPLLRSRASTSADPAAGTGLATCAIARQQTCLGPDADERFARPDVAELTMPTATRRS